MRVTPIRATGCHRWILFYVYSTNGRHELASNSQQWPTATIIRSYAATVSSLFKLPPSGAFFIGVSGAPAYYDYEGGAGNHAYDQRKRAGGIVSTTGCLRNCNCWPAPRRGPVTFRQRSTASEGAVLLTIRSALSEAVHRDGPPPLI